ncbi:Hypothetical predicted protein [Paramuricea clavata]|uniref:Uncharacterized protein n=1 Tax=Paramuricea clavata TaxID=317549 RepID=A0A6S7GAC3_PARCT|nr:Hypothetical predicted protein [Paramuricea clavata]
MFPTFPHNDTFVDNCTLQVNATPVDSNADVYTFIHHKQEYGIMNLQDATISTTISLKDRHNADLGNDQNVSLNILPLCMFWKTKEILINDQHINSVTSQENELVYISHLLQEVPTGYKPGQDINLCIHSTPTHFDTRTNVHDGAVGNVNKGARNRYLACNRATRLECYDLIDIMGDNKRFVPTSFEIKITNLEFFGIKINDAYVNPCVENSCEAYTNLRRVLNRRYDEMSFSHADYQTSYGIIVTDLSPNKDSYNQVLPNSTSGVVSLEMRLSQNYILVNLQINFQMVIRRRRG